MRATKEQKTDAVVGNGPIDVCDKRAQRSEGLIIYDYQRWRALESVFELGRVGAGVGGPKALSMLDIGNPNLNWVSLAEGMGVEATAARTAEEFNVQLESALAIKGPRLIEAIL